MTELQEKAKVTAKVTAKATEKVTEKVTAKATEKVTAKAIGKVALITINSTQNNTILLAKDTNNKHIALTSLGLNVKKKRGKRSVASGAQLSTEFVINKLLELKYSSLFIKTKGFGRGRESALYAFISSSLNIVQVLDITPIPHNGCRLKKARRM
jgi:small subunit ribosomal protein S11